MKDIKTTPRSDVEDWLGGLEPADIEMKDGRHLRAVAAAISDLEQAEFRLIQAVREARRAGDSWEAIGLVLGTSRQAAHRKFASKIGE